MREVVLLALAIGTGCRPVAESDSDPVDTDDTDVIDTDVVRSGLEGKLGTGAMDGAGYVGTEEWYLIGDDGDGTDVCRIGYTLTSTASRTDCADCSWAFDLVVSDAHLVGEADPGCLAALGVDSTALASLDGSTAAYGYSPDYFSHGKVLMIDQGAEWGPVTFAVFDPATGAFSYDWEAGYHDY